MSIWSYVKGIITVEPPGNGQHAKDFVLNTVLDHLPRVTGSEGDMDVRVIRHVGTNSSSNHDEFGQFSNLGSERGHWFNMQTQYDLVLEGHLRDRQLDRTLREWAAWMARLSKRVQVRDVFVEVSCMGERRLFDDTKPWRDNFDDWSWASGCVWSKDVWDKRHSSSWRYNIVNPIATGNGNWVENIASLVPSGNNVARALDYLAGNLEPYEYEDYGEYREDVIKFAARMLDNLGTLCAWNAVQDNEGMSDEELDSIYFDALEGAVEDIRKELFEGR